MSALGKTMTWLGQDGMAHLLASLVLCCVLAAFLPLWIAVLVTAAVGVAKELVWDKWLDKGSASWHDISCDGIGIAAGVAMAILFNF